MIARITGTETTADCSLLCFGIGEHRVAIFSSEVQEIVRMVAVEPLTDSPDIIDGVINFRGSLVPVIKLRQRFGLPYKPISASDYLIVLARKPYIALRVDDVHQIITVKESDIVQTTNRVLGVFFFQLAAVVPGGVIVVLDPATLLSDQQAASLECLTTSS